jgi:branched-chain amino acid aminotransferase
MDAFFNRRFIPEKQVRISAFDRGLLYGDGVFETVRIYGGRFFWLDRHLTRLQRGLDRLGIKIPYNRVELEFFLRELVIRNGVKDGFSRIVVTRGEGLLGFSPRGSGSPQIIMVARPRNLGSWQRRHPVWRLCIIDDAVHGLGFKTLSYLPHVLAKKKAEQHGYEDPILLNPKGEVMEAAASNVFVAGDRTLWTPPLSSGCLEGITRQAVIKIAQKSKFRISEKPMPVSALKKASEIFITNSLLEIVPCVLGKKVPARVPVLTLALQEKFEQFRDAHLE